MSVIIKQIKKENPVPGFENLGFIIHPDCVSQLEIPMINGKYDLGFEKDPQKKEYFEKGFGFSFESKEGQDFLRDFTIEIEHSDTILPSSIRTEFVLHLIKHLNGAGVIKHSGSKEGPVDSFLFQIYDEKQEMTERVSKKQVMLQAAATLNNLYTGKKDQIILVAKFILPVTEDIKNAEIAFDRLSDLILEIDGAKTFLSKVETDRDFMDVVVSVKEAVNRNIIRYDNGYYINYATKNRLGKNLDEVTAFLTNPANQDEFGTGQDDPAYTIKAQLAK